MGAAVQKSHMRAVACCLAVVALLLAGCIMLEVTPISAGERAGARYVTLQPLTLYGAYGRYPDKTITWYFVASVGIANRYHTQIGTVPSGTEIEVVDMLDRTAHGMPHSRIYRIRLRPGTVASFGDDLVNVSAPTLMRRNPDGTDELSRDFFRRID